MRIFALCLLAAITLAACNEPEAHEETPAPSATPAVAKRAPTPTPPSPNWMWKDEKGKPRDNDPLAVKNSGLERPKTKK